MAVRRVLQIKTRYKITLCQLLVNECNRYERYLLAYD